MQGKPKKCRVRGAVRWVVDAHDPLTGKRKRQFFTTKADADAAQQQANQQPRPQQPLPVLLDPDVRVAPFAAEWLWGQIEDGTWTRPATIERYRQQLWTVSRQDLEGGLRLGDLRVRDLQREHAALLVQTLRRAGFAPRTTAQAYQMLSALCDRAVSDRLLPHHPVDRDYFKKKVRPKLQPPKDETVKAFEEHQAQTFLAAAAEHSRLHALYVTGFLTGCRLGELLGLQLEDLQTRVVDGQRLRQLHVARALPRGSTTPPVVGPTKSGKARWVDVGPDLAAVPDGLRTERPALALRRAWRPVPPWCFVTRTGAPIDRAAVGSDFHRILTRAGLADTGLTVHSMRHSFASWHLNRGCNIKWLSQQLGHASVNITLTVYAGWLQARDPHAATALGATLLGNTAGNRGAF